MTAPLPYTVAEAAALLRVSGNLIRRSIDRGEIPAIRLGRVIRIPRHVVDGLLGASVALAPSAAGGSAAAGAGGVNGVDVPLACSDGPVGNSGPSAEVSVLQQSPRTSTPTSLN